MPLLQAPTTTPLSGNKPGWRQLTTLWCPSYWSCSLHWPINCRIYFKGVWLFADTTWFGYNGRCFILQMVSTSWTKVDFWCLRIWWFLIEWSLLRISPCSTGLINSLFVLFRGSQLTVISFYQLNFEMKQALVISMMLLIQHISSRLFLNLWLFVHVFCFVNWLWKEREIIPSRQCRRPSHGSHKSSFIYSYFDLS